MLWCKFSFKCPLICTKNFYKKGIRNQYQSPCYVDYVKGRVFISELEILMIDAITPNKEKI